MTIYKFAGFWRRLVAFMIDNTIATIIFSVLCTIAVLAFTFGSISGNSNVWISDLIDPTHLSSIMIIIYLFYFVIIISYFTYFHGTTGRTPGKMLLGLQVVSAKGAPISFGIAFLRAVGYLVSNLLFIFPLGFVWAAFDKRKQGWHDKIAGTVVIIREQQNETAGISIPDNPTAFPTPQHYVERDEALGESMPQTSKPPENNNN
jgi:uncharacterized RDD family membrane protein YckC